MASAKNGDTASVHYTGKLSDGTDFDSSENRDPLQFTLGQGQLIPGFETAVMGMNIGDTKAVTIPSAQAYGPRQEELLGDVELTQFPSDIKPEKGQQLEMHHPDGHGMMVTVIDVTETSALLDGNHPLAGEDLTFEITVVSIA